jgi:hypothetical protein
MIGLIGKTYLNCGYDPKKDKETISKTLTDLVSDLIKNYGDLTLPEIAICFSRGWKRKYDKLDSRNPQMLILSNSTYFRWLDAYTWDSDRVQAKKELLKIPQFTPVPMTEEQKEKIIHDGAIRCYKDFLDTGVVIDYGNVTYFYLERLGLIHLTDPEKEVIKKKCKARLIQMEEAKKRDMYYVGKHQGINDAIRDLESGTSSKLKSESRRDALKLYFNEVADIGADIEDLINDKK